MCCGGKPSPYVLLGDKQTTENDLLPLIYRTSSFWCFRFGFFFVMDSRPSLSSEHYFCLVCVSNSQKCFSLIFFYTLLSFPSVFSFLPLVISLYFVQYVLSILRALPALPTLPTLYSLSLHPFIDFDFLYSYYFSPSKTTLDIKFV